MAEEDLSRYQYGPPETADLMTPTPMEAQQVLAAKVRKNPALTMPTSGVQRPPPAQQPPAQAPGADYRTQALALLKQAEPAPIDTKAMQEYAARRDEEANRKTVLGLALASMGGESMAPVGGQILKEAMASQGPMKIGGGIIEGGKYIADPEATEDRRLKHLQAQAAIYEQMASHAETVEQRRAAAEAALQMKQLIAEMAAGRQSDTNRGRAFTQENQLRDDFEKQVKDQRISISTFPQIEAALTGPPSAASDMRAIFRYMKMLDPTSVVREGEYATARNATGVPAQVMNLYNKALTGQSLNPQQRADFLRQARSERDTALKYFNERGAEFSNRARTYGLEPRNVVLGYGEPAAPGQQQGGRGTADAPLRVQPGAAPGQRNAEESRL